MKDAPRLLARLQSRQALPEPSDFLALQASLAALLLLRDALVQLAPEGADFSAAAATAEHTAGGATHGLPAFSRAAGPGGGAALASGAAAPLGRRSSPDAPSILFKASALIAEPIVLCALGRGVAGGGRGAAGWGRQSSARLGPCWAAAGACRTLQRRLATVPCYPLAPCLQATTWCLL